MEIVIVIIVILFIIFIVGYLKNSLNPESKKNSHSYTLSKTSGRTNKYRSGEYQVSGYHHLPEEVKRIVWKKLKAGDDLHLIPGPQNKYDNKAIKVIFEGVQIGCVSTKSYRKNKLFDLLVNNEIIKVTCIRNVRGQDDGIGRQPYLGDGSICNNQM